MKISVASSMRSKTWRNVDYSIDELKAKLTQTVRTEENLQAFFKMAKSEQSIIKDRGAFVGGHLADGRRRRGSVLCRSVLCLDADHCKQGDIDNIVKKMPCMCIFHTTHKHTPEAPRIRLVIPLTREVSAEEYLAVAHMVAWGTGLLEMLDDCTYEPERLMFWPTTARDGEFLSGVVDGPWLDPDEYLNLYGDWHDASTWPVSSRVSAVESHGAKEAENPLTKAGIIGAFCRAYPIAEAIEKFIPDVYEATDKESRWTYTGGEGAAGLVVYDGKFAYSHHSTDPCCGLLLNAFDIVRLHRFRDLDAGCAEGTPVVRLPSYGAMAELASKDTEVKKLVVEERLASALEDFKDDTEEEEDPDWRSKLTLRRKSTAIEDTVKNLRLIFANDEKLKGAFAFNELAGKVEVTGNLPWRRSPGNAFWCDDDSNHLQEYLDLYYGTFSRRNFDVAFSNHTHDVAFHPLKDYLASLPPWDGVERVEELFIRYLGAADMDYTRQVTRKTFAAAVARIFEPGVKFDSMLVLDGAQGIGKSSIVRDLIGGKYYNESLSLADMEDGKRAAEKLQGTWICEVSELAGMRKAEVETVKGFLSRTEDSYRPAYGRVVETHPRSCIIIATVNGEFGYLRDLTGNRRFWIVKVSRTQKGRTWNFDENFRAQFWAEAKKIWADGERLYLGSDAEAAAEAAQMGALERDERAGLVQDYLDTPLPKNWDEMELSDRRDYLNGGSIFGSPGDDGEKVRRDAVSNAELWCEVFGKPLAELTKRDSHDLASIMAQIPGWERTDISRRLKGYGKQRLYRRCD